ncbi:MAG: PEP-CTERM sorting domain-containing protein [Pseudomonadales bacterium]|nr:PEP-CTERM sorting domain-containing protein [Pseudomonadales bacterium]
MTIKKQFLAASALALSLGFASYSTATVVYTNDFSSGTATGITGANTVQTAPSTEKFVGFLNYGATSTLSLTGLAAHTSVTIDFDVIGLKSLDGTTYGDNFVLEMNGTEIFKDYYGHSSGYLVGPTTGTLVSHDQTALGYGHFYGGASTYHYSLNFADSAAAISFDFIGNTDQPWTDEAFGLDNIVVSTNAVSGGNVPEPSSIALIALGLLGFGASRRRRMSK